MSHIASVSPTQVRDPQHNPNGTYGRRMKDYDPRAAVIATIVVLAALFGGSLWSTFVQVFANAWNDKPIAGMAAQSAEMRTLIR